MAAVIEVDEAGAGLIDQKIGKAHVRMDQIIAFRRLAVAFQARTDGGFDLFQNRTDISIDLRCIPPVAPCWRFAEDGIHIPGESLERLGLGPIEDVAVAAGGNHTELFEPARHVTALVGCIPFDEVEKDQKTLSVEAVNAGLLDRLTITAEIVAGRGHDLINAERVEPGELALDGAACVIVFPMHA